MHSVLQAIKDSVHHLPLYLWRSKWDTQVWGPNQSAVQVRSLLVHHKLLPSLEITPFGNKCVKWIPKVMLWEWLETEWNEWCERLRQPGRPHEWNLSNTRSALLIFISLFISEGDTSMEHLKTRLLQRSLKMNMAIWSKVLHFLSFFVEVNHSSDHIFQWTLPLWQEFSTLSIEINIWEFHFIKCIS